jgi:anti-sigma regulatory factor (Ser/Thr protein kinase)
MLPSPAESGPDRRSAVGHPAAEGNFMAAPVAEAFDSPDTMAEASVRAGGCFARPLPLDPTCAGAARSLFREAVAGLGLPGDLVHDGVTMASELAANTLHAQGNVEFSGSSQRPVSGFPEFWLYIRGSGARCEVVCRVFDSQPGWKTGSLPDVKIRTAEGVNGRGLQVVDGLSAGEWGAHLTRGRLGSWKVSGKAVWFALRVPPTLDVARNRRPALSPWRAVSELEAMLGSRGLGGRLVRADEPGAAVSVLSVSRDLTVWCHSGIASWRSSDGSYQRQAMTDLVDVAEQIVWTHEELRAAETVG